MKSGLRPVSSLLSRLPDTTRRLQQQVQLLQAVQLALPAELRGRCEGVTLNGESLVLLVTSSVWASRFRFLQSELLEAVRAMGAKRVEIRILPPRIRVPSNRRPHSISKEASALLRLTARSVGDDELGAALERLARHTVGSK